MDGLNFNPNYDYAMNRQIEEIMRGLEGSYGDNYYNWNAVQPDNMAPTSNIDLDLDQNLVDLNLTSLANSDTVSVPLDSRTPTYAPPMQNHVISIPSRAYSHNAHGTIETYPEANGNFRNQHIPSGIVYSVDGTNAAALPREYTSRLQAQYRGQHVVTEQPPTRPPLHVNTQTRSLTDFELLSANTPYTSLASSNDIFGHGNASQRSNLTTPFTGVTSNPSLWSSDTGHQTESSAPCGRPNVGMRSSRGGPRRGRRASVATSQPNRETSFARKRQHEQTGDFTSYSPSNEAGGSVRSNCICQYCSGIFTNSSSRRRHQTKHCYHSPTKAEKLVCSFVILGVECGCLQGFSRNDALQTHLWPDSGQCRHDTLLKMQTIFAALKQYTALGSQLTLEMDIDFVYKALRRHHGDHTAVSAITESFDMLNAEPTITWSNDAASSRETRGVATSASTHVQRAVQRAIQEEKAQQDALQAAYDQIERQRQRIEELELQNRQLETSLSNMQMPHTDPLMDSIDAEHSWIPS